LHVDILDRDEGNDVHRTDPGVAAPLFSQIDVLERHGRGLDERGLNGSRLSDQADHEAVVVLVCAVIEKDTPGSAAKGFDNRLNYLGTTTFAVIGDTFDQLVLHDEESPQIKME